MKLSDSEVRQYHEQGYLLIPAFLDATLLAEAQSALWQHFPEPEMYRNNPEKYEYLSNSQFAGLVSFPFEPFAINRLVVAEGIIDIAEQLLDTPDIRLTKGELWAKYQGAIDYDQGYHRDFGNHTLVVPRADHRYKELTTFLFLSDVTQQTGATALIPRPYTEDIPLWNNRLPGDYDATERVYAEGPAGTLLLYSYDIFHRGRQIHQPDASRFMVLADYARRDAPWIDRHAWPHHGGKPAMNKFISKINVRQRNLMDFPPPGHPYWDTQTLGDIQMRYPEMDINPYLSANRPDDSPSSSTGKPPALMTPNCRD